MKFFASILSFYILVLTAIPCVDRPFEKTANQSEFSKNTTDNHGQDGDHCSPFCNCNCCGNHVVSIENIVLSNVFSFPEKLVFWYTPNFKSNPYHSIWQPPKAS